jgi:peptidoglycan hydrolase-like protein with peptidoglycan-binding domain
LLSVAELSLIGWRRFQRASGLKVDGVVGGKTVRKITQETTALQQFLADGSKGTYEGSVVRNHNTARAYLTASLAHYG